MASVWKHPQSKNWMARYRGAEGKTVNRSTGTPEKNEAERIAQSWEIEAAREREKKTIDVSAGGISDSLARAERLARQGRLDEITARDIINDMLRASGKQSLDMMTHRAWSDFWQANRKGKVTERTRMKYEQVCRDWQAFLGPKAEQSLDGLQRMDAVAFRERLSGEGLSPRTVNQTIKLLRSVYQEAIEQGHLGRNPFAGIGAQRDDAEDAKREPFTTKEVESLIMTAEGDWKGLVMLAATSGLRLMDCARLQWRCLDLEAKRITVRTSKTGAIVEVPIHDSLMKWLKLQPRGIGPAPVFPSLANKGGAGKSGLSMAFKRLMERAKISSGVARTAEKKSRGRTTSKKSFHSLRYFVVSELAKAKVRPEVARAITGHADAETHANYVRLDFETVASAMKSIEISA